VIPAYNEGERISGVIAEIRSVLGPVDIVVVDDGSADDTPAQARSAGAWVVPLPVNLGYGAALQAGYKFAIRNDYTLVVQMDGDGQHDSAYLPRLIEAARAADVDVVIGSRFLDRDGHYRPSRARKLGMALFGRIASAVTRQHVSDPTSGFQVIDIRVARFFCTDVYPADYPDADILILLHRSGFRIKEVGVQMRPPPGKSMHSGHRSIYYVYKMCLSIFVTLLRRRG
jgi:glycosyltransferase involved in cell wall biosynthesis